MPTFAKDALASLQAVISAETTRLRALKSEYLGALAAIDRANAVSRAHFDDSHSAVLSRRYETACERELRRAMAELCPPRHAQKGEKSSAPAQTPQPTPPESVEQAVPSEPEPLVRNEPKVVAPQTAPMAPLRRRMVDETPSNGTAGPLGGIFLRRGH